MPIPGVPDEGLRQIIQGRVWTGLRQRLDMAALDAAAAKLAPLVEKAGFPETGTGLKMGDGVDSVPKCSASGL